MIITTNKLLRVGLYIRCSTEEQVKHGYTVQAQSESLIEYCKQKKYKIIDVYIDKGKTARSKLKNRKEMLRLLDDVKLHKLDRVVFIKLDRWFRNIADYYKVQETLEKYNVDWETTQEEYNTTTASGRLNLNIRLSIAQDEADRTGDRIRFTFENMVKNGRAIGGKHMLPFGFKVVGEDRNKKVVIDDTEKEIVVDMFEHFKLHQSARQTLQYINTKYNLTINYDSIRRYFKNPLYYGCYRKNENYCEPYFTKEYFDKIQSILNKNIKSASRNYDYIFSGLLKCTGCGCNYSGYNHRCTRPKYNKVYEYPAYKCNKAYNSKLCPNTKIILENALEKYLLNHVVDKISEYILECKQVNSSRTNNKINISKVQSKIDRLNELYIEGKITKEKYDDDYFRLASIIKQNKQPIKKIDTEKWKQLLESDFLTIYKTLNNKNKRSVWRSFIEYIEIGGDEPNIILKDV